MSILDRGEQLMTYRNNTVESGVELRRRHELAPATVSGIRQLVDHDQSIVVGGAQREYLIVVNVRADRCINVVVC